MESRIEYVELPDLPNVPELELDGVLYVNLSAVSKTREELQSRQP